MDISDFTLFLLFCAIHSYVLMCNQKVAVEHQEKKNPLTYLTLDISTTRWYHMDAFKL